MFGIQTSELVVIALIAILLFGPERVPEFFHRLGKLTARLQRSADDLWTSLQTEMNQATKPLQDLGRDLDALGTAPEADADPGDEEAGPAGAPSGPDEPAP